MDLVRIPMGRRTFLRAGLTTAGALVVGTSCGKGGRVLDVGDPAIDPSRPTPRLTLRLPGGDYGFPAPLNYLPPGYSRMIMVYDTLLWPDSKGALQPWLASGYQRSPDGLIYTFQLRDNVRWHDGRPMTAEDVVFTFDYFAQQKQNLPQFLIVTPESVAGVRATGPLTVEITLNKPVVTFARTVASGFPIIPRHVWSSIADVRQANDLSALVGTGPYKLQQYGRGEGSYLYVANDDFFLGKPFVERVELRPVADELNALRTGDIDAGAGSSSGTPVSGSVVDRFRRDPDFGVIEGPPDFPAVLYWNGAKGGALADVRFRRACAHAINRDNLVKRVLGGQGHPGNPGFLPAGHPFRVDVEQYPFSRDTANRLLDEAGYRRSGSKGVRQGPDGQALRFKLLAFPALAALIELVQADLEAVGIQLEIDPIEPFRIFIGNVDYEMAVFFYAGVSSDPDYMRIVYSTRRPKTTFQSTLGYASPEFDDLADRQLVTADQAERKRLVARMQEIVAADVPILPLWYPTPFQVYRKSVFDQWSFDYDGGGPYNKQVLVTGRNTGGLAIRPTRDR